MIERHQSRRRRSTPYHHGTQAPRDRSAAVGVLIASIAFR
jgi:hypothetical protein